MTNRLTIASAFALSLPLLAPALHGQKWTAPTPEELSMTSIPEVPGAAAVYLYKEQSTDDGLHMHSYYVRLKVLNDRGKEYANVELPFLSGEYGYSIDEIAGRTIHPDGSIVPFTDKPYEKLVVKTGGYKYKEKVFTLPAVDVGSIIEYRYKLRFDDNYYSSPDWFIQSDIYVRKAHYMWRPTNAMLTSEDGNDSSSSIAWTPMLPADAKIVQTALHTSSVSRSSDPTTQLDLDVHDVPPVPKEEYMPPIDSVSYRVLFYYTDVKNAKEFWDKRGKSWSKARDKFIGPKSGVRNYVNTLVAPGDTQDQKARKLYAAVMQMENTDFTRARTSSEEKAVGLKQISSTDDILERKRGEGDQLAELFVAMCRAAGLKAYLMGVADRSQRLFLPQYLSLRQLDDYIAIVNIDGKEVYFDPGQRYCEPEHLAWKHTVAGGLRQTDNGYDIVATAPENYKYSLVKRLADLTLNERGEATGTVTLSFTGDPALRWRQEALRGDDTSLNDDLRSQMEKMLPGGMEVRVTKVENLANYDQPLKVIYDVKGSVGSSTGKRLLLPADIFESNSKPAFTEPKREIAVDMHYASMDQDAVRYSFPASITIESLPEPDHAMMKQVAAFETFSRKNPTSVSVFRNVTIGTPVFAPAEYDELRSFYSKMETKDQETLVLTHAAPTTASAGDKPAGK
jgi:hypothetical protein